MRYVVLVALATLAGCTAEAQTAAPPDTAALHLRAVAAVVKCDMDSTAMWNVLMEAYNLGKADAGRGQ
jgi:hypothetical protein